MGFIRNLNFRRHTSTLRTLDYENAAPSQLREEGSTSGRISDSLYEGTTRVPHRDDAGESVGPAIHAMPTEKPHPAAQWDDVRGVWIRWDPEVGDWVDVPVDDDAPDLSDDAMGALEPPEAGPDGPAEEPAE